MNKYKGKSPNPRVFHSSIIICKRYLVISGGLSQDEDVFNDIFIYDIQHEEYIEVLIDINKNCKH